MLKNANCKISKVKIRPKIKAWPKGGVSRSSWTKKNFEVVIWPIEQQINHDL